MSKGTVQFLLTRLFSLGKIFGGKWGKSCDIKRRLFQLLYHGQVYQKCSTEEKLILNKQINLGELGGTQTKQFSSTLSHGDCSYWQQTFIYRM